MSTFNAVLAQYEKNKAAASGNTKKVITQEERFKKFFFTVLEKGQKDGERRIRILPTKDGSSPFKEVFFHEQLVDGKWLKLWDPKQEGSPSPLNDVYDSLMMTGVESDRELARDFRARKFYIVKVIDRDNEEDGPKFWRFKHNHKGDGIIDKIFPIWQKKGDVTDTETGRDLTLFLTLTKSGNGKEYTAINTIMAEDPSPLSTKQEDTDLWVSDEQVWSDVYAKKSFDFLSMVAKGEVPRWDSNLGKYASNTESNETIGGDASPKSEIIDTQSDEEEDDDLPF